jgi:hypothetical protein
MHSSHLDQKKMSLHVHELRPQRSEPVARKGSSVQCLWKSESRIAEGGNVCCVSVFIENFDLTLLVKKFAVFRGPPSVQ